MTFNRNNPELFKIRAKAEVEKAIAGIDVEEWCEESITKLENALQAVRQDLGNQRKLSLLRALARNSRHWGSDSKANQSAKRWKYLESKSEEIWKEFNFS